MRSRGPRGPSDIGLFAKSHRPAFIEGLHTVGSNRAVILCLQRLLLGAEVTDRAPPPLPHTLLRMQFPSQPWLKEGLAPRRRRLLEELSASFPPFICDNLLPNPAMPPWPHCPPSPTARPTLTSGAEHPTSASWPCPGTVLPIPLYRAQSWLETEASTKGQQSNFQNPVPSATFIRQRQLQVGRPASKEDGL